MKAIVQTNLTNLVCSEPLTSEYSTVTFSVAGGFLGNRAIYLVHWLSCFVGAKSVYEIQRGDVAERPNAPVLKTGEVIPPRVQIPPSPPQAQSLVSDG